MRVALAIGDSQGSFEQLMHFCEREGNISHPKTMACGRKNRNRLANGAGSAFIDRKMPRVCDDRGGMWPAAYGMSRSIKRQAGRS